MSVEGKKIAPLVTASGEHHGWAAFCPACRNVHVFDNRWAFNGKVDNPSFTPSMLVHPHEGGQKRCHSYLENGFWKYLGDCEHEMKNQTVAVPDFKWSED